MSRFDLQHFDRSMPIADPNTGLATPYFLQMMFGNTGSAEDTEDSVAALEARQIIAGFGLDGGGPLSSDVQIDLNAAFDDLSDVDMTTTPPADGEVPTWDDANGKWVPGAGGGGGGSLTLIASFVATGSETVATFSGITGDYYDLLVAIEARGSTAATTVGLNLTFNNDTGSNYDRQRIGGANITADGAQGVAVANIPLAVTGSTAPTSVPCATIGTIVNYSGTTFQKTAYFDYAYKTANSSGNIQNQSMAGFWRSTAAITRLDFTLASGTFVAGSTIHIYGRGPAPVSGGSGGLTEIAVTNPDFASGTLTGWTAETSTYTATADSTAPTGGGYRLVPAGVALVSIYQDIDLSSLSADIAAGRVLLTAQLWWFDNFTDTDQAGVEFLFRNSTPADMGVVVGPDNSFNASALWQSNRTSCFIPVGAVTLRLRIASRRASGTNNDAHPAGVKLWYQILE